MSSDRGKGGPTGSCGATEFPGKRARGRPLRSSTGRRRDHFEWGTGFYINPVPPEQAAAFLHETEVDLSATPKR